MLEAQQKFCVTGLCMCAVSQEGGGQHRAHITEKRAAGSPNTACSRTGLMGSSSASWASPASENPSHGQAGALGRDRLCQAQRCVCLLPSTEEEEEGGRLFLLCSQRLPGHSLWVCCEGRVQRAGCFCPWGLQAGPQSKVLCFCSRCFIPAHRFTFQLYWPESSLGEGAANLSS